MFSKLSDKERDALRVQHKQERDKRICDRIKAVLLCDRGYSDTKIAEILLLDDETIRRHIKDYFEQCKLAPENGGSSSYLSVLEEKELIAHLKEKSYPHVKAIVIYVSHRFGKKYSISGMTKWLRFKGFRYKKPHPIPAKLDPAKQALFLAYYQHLKENATNKEPIYFSDSTHPQHQTRLSYGWIFKGVRRIIKTTARQRRLNLIGGLCLAGHKLVYQSVDSVNSDSISSFLKQLRKKHPGQHRIHLIWDNASYHRSKQVVNQAKKLKIALHYLPPYSPNLNPIERLWKMMHEQVTYNQYYEKFSDFSLATIDFLKRLVGKRNYYEKELTIISIY